MQPRRKGGKRSRKLARGEKRRRYNVSFERRYGMSRSAWIEYKKSADPSDVHARRERARQRI